jgi:hypothetical protein
MALRKAVLCERKKLCMLSGGGEIGDEGGRGCKTALHHPVSGDPGGRPRRGVCKWSEVWIDLTGMNGFIPVRYFRPSRFHSSSLTTDDTDKAGGGP